MTRSLLGHLWIAIGLIACQPAVATQMIVEVVAHPETSRRTTEVRVFVEAQPDGTVSLDRTVFFGAAGDTSGFPLTIPLVPLGGDAARRFRLVAYAYEFGSEINRASVTSGYARDRRHRLRVVLDDACLGAERYVCEAGQTCRNGVCESDIPQPPNDELGWSEMSTDGIRPVCASEAVFGDLGDADCSAVLLYENAAVADPLRDRILFFGGWTSIPNYQGNEVYAFDVPSQRYLRVSDPTPPPVPYSCTVGGTPGYRSPWNAAFNTTLDRMFIWGGESMCPETWALNPASGVWSSGSGPTRAAPMSNTPMAFDEVSGAVFAFDTDRLWRFDVASDTFAQVYVGDHSAVFGTAVLLPALRRMYVIGSDSLGLDPRFYRIELDVPEVRSVVAPGCERLAGAVRPGLAFDPSTGMVVGWTGGDEVTILDPSSDTCRTEVHPGGPEGEYVGGRFQYFDTLQGFLAVTDATRGPFVLRLR